MTEHTTKPVSANLWPAGWVPLGDDLEMAYLVDADHALPDGTPLFARLTYRDLRTVATREGAAMISPDQVEILQRTASVVLAPVILPPTAAMGSLEWSERHDLAVWAKLRALGWDGRSAVAGIGKQWVIGAPPGRSWLYGWFGKPGGGYWQPRPAAGSPGPHNDLHHDYGTTSILVRPRAKTSPPNPPSGSVVGSVVSAVASAAAQAADVLRGLLASDGANPPEPPRTKPMPTLAADLPCVTSTVRAAGYRPTRSRRVRLVVLHTAECAETAKSAEAVAGYFASLKDRAASAHFCVDSDSIVQCVPLSGTAWAAPGANDDGVQIELAGYAGQGAAGWADAYSVAMLDRAATLVAQLCERYSLPVAYVDEAGLLAGLAGVTTHAAVSRAWRRSTHTDPGPTFPLAAFLDSVRAKMST